MKFPLHFRKACRSDLCVPFRSGSAFVLWMRFETRPANIPSPAPAVRGRVGFRHRRWASKPEGSYTTAYLASAQAAKSVCVEGGRGQCNAMHYKFTRSSDISVASTHFISFLYCTTSLISITHASYFLPRTFQEIDGSIENPYLSLPLHASDRYFLYRSMGFRVFVHCLLPVLPAKLLRIIR